jgi:hypothetical protein
LRDPLLALLVNLGNSPLKEPLLVRCAVLEHTHLSTQLHLVRIAAVDTFLQKELQAALHVELETTRRRELLLVPSAVLEHIPILKLLLHVRIAAMDTFRLKELQAALPVELETFPRRVHRPAFSAVLERIRILRLLPARIAALDILHLKEPLLAFCAMLGNTHGLRANRALNSKLGIRMRIT